MVCYMQRGQFGGQIVQLHPVGKLMRSVWIYECVDNIRCFLEKLEGSKEE